MRELTSRTERGRLLYLSQIDTQIKQFMPRNSSFVFDLATRLLLETGVVVTDVYFFISDEVAADINRRNESWIWNGLRRGLIVPAFREKGVNSFEDNLQRGVRQSTTIGVREDDRELAIKLDAAISGVNTPKITWPDGVGISFGRLANSEFGHQSPDSDLWGDRERSLWDISRPVREKYLELGWLAEQNPMETGLRRGSIFAAMAKDVGFRGDPSDTRGIINSVTREKRSAMRATILWIDELYHYNHASLFRVKPSFPVSAGPGALMLPGLLWRGPKHMSESSVVETYSHSVRWPSRSMMAKASPDKLLGLRNDEAGLSYIDRLVKFRTDPNETTWEALTAAADNYAVKVCNIVSAEVSSGLEMRHIVGRSGLSVGLIAAGIAASDASSYIHSLPARIASAITTGVAALYLPMAQYLKVRMASRESIVALTGNRGGEIQVDLPPS